MDRIDRRTFLKATTAAGGCDYRGAGIVRRLADLRGD